MPYLYYFICLMLLCSCGGNSTREKGNGETEIALSTAGKNEVKYVNSIKITSPGKNKIYNFGEDITIQFENKEHFPIDSSSVFINGHEIARLDRKSVV